MCTTVEPSKHFDILILLQEKSIFPLCIINFHILYNNMLLRHVILVVVAVLLNQGILLKGLDNIFIDLRVPQVTGCWLPLSFSK